MFVLCQDDDEDDKESVAIVAADGRLDGEVIDRSDTHGGPIQTVSSIAPAEW